MSDHSGGGDGGSDGGVNWFQLALSAAEQSNRPEPAIREGRRLTHLQLLTARPGQPVARVFGRMRVGGQIIWRGKVREHISESGGEDGDKGGNSASARRRDYRYSMHLAIGLCEGPITHIGRIWADGVLLDTTWLNMELHRGEADAVPDPLIEGAMGEASPAFRGLAYLMLRDFDITRFNNRVPQLSFEVFCPVDSTPSPTQAVCLLPGASEFAYHPEPHVRVLGMGRAASENVTAHAGQSDWEISLDQLQAAHPNCKQVALVVSWFGSDLRAEHCRLSPKVDNKDKHTVPSQWQVAGLTRKTAARVSLTDAEPSFGGTPSDASVVEAIRDLHRRGLGVMFYPFIMMDIPKDNTLPNPYEDGAYQPAFPWRGRISCHPAAGQSGSPDGTSGVAAQVDRFVNGSGDGGFGLRDMVRHYAHLCAEAGGVEAFLLASELPGLSKLHDAKGHYPFAGHLVALSDEVREILPESKISFAADWTEYGAHVSANGDVGFPLDAFWAHKNCDFIGMDNYLPLADWRDTHDHLDAATASGDIYDPDYLKGNVRGGEFFDYYYKTPADRDAQKRTPITDGQGQAWLHRAKDIRGWWSNSHRIRRKGRQGAHTAWQSEMKPIWFTELGCPAVDKGANQPNVFPDDRSSEGAVPYFSNGTRDDHMQTCYLKAMTEFYAEPAHNPISKVYGAPMLAEAQIYLWAWDARPFPVFPYRTDVWRDGVNWHTGHWLNGRYASAPLTPLLQALAGDTLLLTQGLSGVVDGYALRGVSTAAADMEPLMRAFAMDAIGGQKHMRVVGRTNRAVREVRLEDVLPRANGDIGWVRKITALEKLPRRFDVHYLDAESDYGAAYASARHGAGEQPVAQLDLPVAMTALSAARLAARLLYEARTESEALSLRLPPSYLDLEIGDIFTFAETDEKTLWRVLEITYGTALEVQARRFQPGLYGAQGDEESPANLPPSLGQISLPVLRWLDIPAPALRYHANAIAGVPLLAGFAAPWPGQISLEPEGLRALSLTVPSQMGETKSILKAGPIGRWDRGTQIEVELYAGTLAAAEPLDVLSGLHRLAIETPKGWEIIQFAKAELIGTRRYILTGLLRGQFGSDAKMAEVLQVGASLVVLSDAQVPLAASASLLASRTRVDFGSPDLPRDGYGWQQLDIEPTRSGLQCLSPAHFKCRKPRSLMAAAGDWELTWIRRSREGGDDFDAVTVPIGEVSEAYELIVYAGSKELARHRLVVPRFTLTQAMRDEFSGQIGRLQVAQINSSGLAGSPSYLDVSAL